MAVPLDRTSVPAKSTFLLFRKNLFHLFNLLINNYWHTEFTEIHRKAPHYVVHGFLTQRHKGAQRVFGVDGSFTFVERLGTGVDGSFSLVERLGTGVDRSFSFVERLGTGVDDSFSFVERLGTGVDDSFTFVERLGTGVDDSFSFVEGLGTGVDGSSWFLERSLYRCRWVFLVSGKVIVPG